MDIGSWHDLMPGGSRCWTRQACKDSQSAWKSFRGIKIGGLGDLGDESHQKDSRSKADPCILCLDSIQHKD